MSATVECVGDGKGDGCSKSDSVCNSGTGIAGPACLASGDLLPGDTDVRPIGDNFGVLVPCRFDPGGGIFTGRGNRCPLSFFLRARRKKVVVVETVCVVVVSAYIPWSPELASDREDSEIRDGGNGRDVLDASPYAGGAPLADIVDNRLGCSKLT